MLNINPNTDDIFYRYKMPKIEIRNAGRGNGSYTFLDNIDKVAEAINTPVIILLNYISKSLGSACNIKKKTINGHYTNDKILEEIYKFISFFVLCEKCSIPEVIPIVKGTKKNKILEMKCSACGETYELKSNSKNICKTIENIIKNINCYEIKKGNIVSQTNDSSNSFN